MPKNTLAPGRKRAFKEGDIINNATIMGFVSSSKGAKYTYVCQCGKTGLLCPGDLKKRKCKRCLGYSSNCGFNEILRTYRYCAKRRRLTFLLTPSEFASLIYNCCGYCGAGPSNMKTQYKTKIAYNGIDRIDNEKGYVTSNCITACNTCNKAKGVMSKDEFLDWVKRVYKFSCSG